MKILIIEDEDSLRKNLTDQFEQERFQTISAKDGEEGIRRALEEKPDLILLDILMPKMDGMTVMRQLRASGDWGSHLPIILLTNLNPTDDIVRGVTEGAPAYYLVKSDTSLEQIVKKVKEVLAERDSFIK